MKKVFPDFLYKKLEKKLVENFGFNVKVPILKLKKTDDNDLKFLADYVYENIFLNYTAKQWAVKPEEISHEVTERVPVYISRDNRYFQDKYQGLPIDGYTKTIENILNNNNIEIKLNTDMHDLIEIDYNTHSIFFEGKEFHGRFIYTGLIDEFFNYKFGKLPYRSLYFKFCQKDQDYFQPNSVINYPNNYNFTRITEFKHMTGQIKNSTTFIKEYPGKYLKDSVNYNIPYYPIFTPQNQNIYRKYRDEAKKYTNLTMLGRLAEYKYYDMDDIVERALNIFEQIKN